MPVDRNIIREFFLRGNPNPTREGCPDRAILQAIADNSLPPNHPARLHLASCSPCFAEFRKLKEHHEGRATKHRRRLMAALAVAAGVIIAAVIWLYGKAPYGPIREVALAERTVNLWDRGTLRGDEQGNVNLALPRNRIRLRIILPRLSEPGKYTIGIARERLGKNLVEGAGNAVANGSQETVTVTVDLRAIERGIYFLTTTRDDEQASYYYPVSIT
jgi:hypothetical protein